MRLFRLASLQAMLLVLSIAPKTAKSEEPPLPSVQSVIDRVVQHAGKEEANDQQFEQRYSYTRDKVTEFRNADDQVLRRERKTGHHDPRSAKVARPTRASSKPRDSKTQRGASAGAELQGKALEKKDFALDRELLSRFRFKLVRRELIHGRPTLVLDFQPASSHLPERTFKDRFINRAAGRAWVDEADYVVVKAALHLTEPVRVLGGLVGAVWVFSYGFDRERTSDGLWFTRQVEWHFEGREVLVHRIIDYQEHTTNVRRVV